MNDTTATGGDDAALPATAHGPLASAPVTRARRTPGVALTDTRTDIDMRRMRAYRLGRVREQLAQRDVGACVLYDPVNVRYATGSRNMSVWMMHNASRYCFIPVEGPVVLFDFHNCEHLAASLETVQEVRPARSWFFFSAGPELETRARRWALEIADLVRAHGGGNRRLAIDHCNPEGVAALAALGVEVCNAQAPVEIARSIKSEDEIACMNVSLSVCESAIARMREELRPGVTENRLWAILNSVNAEMGGEWLESRLLTSGGHTNPWFQEASDRVVRAGELVSFDTDLIGPFGYCADVSRSFFCGPGRPNPRQRELYRLAWEQIHHDMALLRPGLGYRELSEKAWKIPDRFLPNRYSSIVHGVGLCDEYPKSPHLQDFERGGYDGVYRAGMTVCVESYMGEAGGDEGVKLEQQVLITGTGAELLSTFPFEEDLLGREL